MNKDIEIIFIRDSDGLSFDWRQKLIEYGEKKEVHLFLLEKYEIENYLLNGDLIYRALHKKYSQKDLPSVEVIENKIYEFLENTVIMSRYKYADNLEDSIFKASLILNLQEYRNSNEVKREAEKIRMGYEENGNKEILKNIGMGKEALKQIFSWFNNEMKLNLNKEDILEAMEAGDIPSEIRNILKVLQSNILQKEDISKLERYDENFAGEENFSEGENSIDEIIQLTLPLDL